MDPTPCLPIPRSLHVEALLLADDGLTIVACSEDTDIRCPVCGEAAARVHGRYRRTLADLPWATLAADGATHVGRLGDGADRHPVLAEEQRLDVE